MAFRGLIRLPGRAEGTSLLTRTRLGAGAQRGLHGAFTRALLCCRSADNRSVLLDSWKKSPLVGITSVTVSQFIQELILLINSPAYKTRRSEKKSFQQTYIRYLAVSLREWKRDFAVGGAGGGYTPNPQPSASLWPGFMLLCYTSCAWMVNKMLSVSLCAPLDRGYSLLPSGVTCRQLYQIWAIYLNPKLPHLARKTL